MRYPGIRPFRTQTVPVQMFYGGVVNSTGAGCPGGIAKTPVEPAPGANLIIIFCLRTQRTPDVFSPPSPICTGIVSKLKKYDIVP